MKKVIIVSLIVTIFVLAFGCNSSKKDEQEDKLKKILHDNNYQIIDVRTEAEFLELHVKDAINIPYDMLESSSLLDKNKTILVYCKSGARSKIAYDTLKSLGYDVYDLGSIDKVSLEKE